MTPRLVVPAVASFAAALANSGRACLHRQVVPDDLLTFDAAISAWSRPAVRWRMSGSLRAAVLVLPQPGNVMYIGGETFLTFDDPGQVTDVQEGCVRWQRGY